MQYQLFRKIVERVEVGHDYVTLSIKADALMAQNNAKSNELVQLKMQMQLKRCGHNMRLVITGENKRQTLKDQGLIDHLSKAY